MTRLDRAGLRLALLVSLGATPAVAQEASRPIDVAGALGSAGAYPAPTTAAAPSRSAKRANLGGRTASAAVRAVADWVVDSGDNEGMPFVIVDKVEAKVFVFSDQGRLNGAAPALLGSTRGEDSTPGIGDKKLSDIGPNERTTPAGRFVASLGQDLGEKDVLWVDYKNAIAMHRVVTTNPREHRLQRLATPSALDKRISYGCINVPAAFYESVVRPAFIDTSGVVYVLPETRSIQSVIAKYYAADAG